MPNATTAAEWDREYRAGRWRFLGGLAESARYGIIALWLAETGTHARVLDVGCGEALLFRRLAPLGLERYVGVDLAGAALEAAEIDPARAALHAADLHGFSPASGESFSAVVFNEVLHFSEEPVRQLERYARFLAPGGAIAVSMYVPRRPESGAHRLIADIWQATGGEEWEVLDDLLLYSERKQAHWKLRLLRPLGRGP